MLYIVSFSKSASDESEPAASRWKFLVCERKPIVFLLRNFKQKMLQDENFEFGKHPLVTEYMSEDVKQSFGELYGGRNWPPTAEWVKIFNERWTPCYNSMTNLPEL